MSTVRTDEINGLTTGRRRQRLLTVVSVGAGQDSTALLYRIGLDPVFRERYAPGHVLAILSATGDEHAETDAHAIVLAEFCAAHDIEWQHLTFDRGYHSGSWADGLAGFYAEKNTIGSAAYPKTCSDNLKIQPIYRFLARWIAERFGGVAYRKRSLYDFCDRYGKIAVIIGFAAGEDDRIADTSIPHDCDKCDGFGQTLEGRCKPCKGSGVQQPRSKWFAQCIEPFYPLQEIGWDRQACQDYIKSIGRPVPPPSNCYMCPYKSPDEIVWSWLTDPARFLKWVAFEANKLAANQHMNAVRNPRTGKVENKNYGVNKLVTLIEVRDKRLAHYYAMGWSLEAIYAHVTTIRMSHGHCVKSKW